MQLSIAVGKSRETKVWKNTKISWAALVTRLSETMRTLETYKEYASLSDSKAGKEKQAIIKDHGGFVGGYLKDGKRSPGSVVFRQIITLDLDVATLHFWSDFMMFYSAEAVLHSTHKHSPKTPRYRLVMPLDRAVSPDQYEAIARRVAGSLDINLFDPTTFQPERLMYWPTTSKDGEYVFEHQEGHILCADKILDTYIDWQDISEWPMLESEKDFTRLGGKQQGIPGEKPGLIGAFNRAYPISLAIETFLPDVYVTTANEDRYTFAEGSAAAGAIVYGNDEFIYSHHGTDPGHNKLLNSWDLVRLHKFGFEDDGEKELSKQKSQRLMSDLAADDTEVIKQVGKRSLPEEDFADLPEDYDFDWLGTLIVDKYGKYEPNTPNFATIIANDPALAGRLKYNLFSHREYAKLPLPWREGTGVIEMTDKDDAELRHYLEKKYNIYNAGKFKDAVSRVFNQNTFHPIRDYIDKLVWDGTARLDTLLIDCLGAEDTQFNRMATRKAITAAVARVYNPGCKFDYVLTLVGPEGIKKSTVPDILAAEWFSDSFMGVSGKEAYEQLQGVWIVELAELTAIKKADVEAVKHFVSKRKDRFRVAYGTRTQEFPRQCIFIGTTNEDHFLKGTTGNRRFWPVAVDGYGLMDVSDIEVDQVWAEAKQFYDAGEKLYFDMDIEQDAKEVQNNYTEADDRSGLIQDYLETLLPADWTSMDLPDRRNFLHSHDALSKIGEVQRLSVCVAEIWTELFRADMKDMGPHNTKYIHQIMCNMPGWEKSEHNKTFPIYGKQRAYVVNKNVTHHNKKKAERKSL